MSAPLAANTSSLAAILDWLSQPPLPDAAADLAALAQQRVALGALALSGPQRLQALNRLAARTVITLNGTLPQLSDLPLPLPRKSRGLAHALLSLSAGLAADFRALTTDPDTAAQLGAQRTQIRQHTLHLLRMHLEIAGLTATPPAHDVWSSLHATYAAAEAEGQTDGSDGRGEPSVRQEYATALLLGLIPAGALSTADFPLARRLAAALAGALEFLPSPDERRRGLFWLDPSRDTPPTALTRRPPPPETRVRWIAGDRAARRLAQLATTGQADRLGFPGPNGAAMLQQHQPTLDKLAELWGAPAKRRFPRRRQNYRALLCVGLPTSWALLAGKIPSEGDWEHFSQWMITNESPDGYAAMHLSGRTEPIRPGDVVAIKGEKSSQWDVALVRWVVSENPEHLELGLQLVAPRVQAARAIDLQHERAGETPALFLPGLPALRPEPALLVPAGTLDETSTRLRVVLEQPGTTAAVLETHPTGRLETTPAVILLQLAGA